jgi:hypothetical protein
LPFLRHRRHNNKNNPVNDLPYHLHHHHHHPIRRRTTTTIFTRLMILTNYRPIFDESFQQNDPCWDMLFRNPIVYPHISINNNKHPLVRACRNNDERVIYRGCGFCF